MSEIARTDIRAAGTERTGTCALFRAPVTATTAVEICVGERGGRSTTVGERPSPAVRSSTRTGRSPELPSAHTPRTRAQRRASECESPPPAPYSILDCMHNLKDGKQCPIIAVWGSPKHSNSQSASAVGRVARPSLSACHPKMRALARIVLARPRARDLRARPGARSFT